MRGLITLFLFVLVVGCTQDNAKEVSYSASSDSQENEEKAKSTEHKKDSNKDKSAEESDKKEPKKDISASVKDESKEIKEQKSSSETDIQNFVNSEIIRLGYQDNDNLETVDFHGDGLPEILTILHGDERDHILIHEYNQASKEWNIVYQDDSHENFNGYEELGIFEKLSMLDDPLKEQTVIGSVSGSGGFLSFEVLAEVDNEIKKVLDKWDGDYSAGDIYSEGAELVVTSNGSEVARFTNKDFGVDQSEDSVEPATEVVNQIEVFLNESQYYVGEGINNEANGFGKIIDEITGGVIFEGEFKNNAKNGPGKMFVMYDGVQTLVYEGGFQNDVKHGEGISYDFVGEIISHEMWENGELIDEY